MLVKLQPQLLPVPKETPVFQQEKMLVKLEQHQWTSSVKYRLVYSKLLRAMQSDVVHSAMTLTEVTSGSTGVALAFAGWWLKMKVELHSYTTADPAKCRQIRKWGARLHLHSPDVPIEDLFAEVHAGVQKGTHWHLDQYDRKSFAAAYQNLGEEFCRQIGERDRFSPRFFVCPVGTGGLIQGVGSYLKMQFPQLEITAVEPESDSPIDGMRNTEEMHLGADDPYDRSFPEFRYTVPAPSSKVRLDGHCLGESASAVYSLITREKWRDVLWVAPD